MRFLGLDIGIASIGWAVVDLRDGMPSDSDQIAQLGEILAMGVRTFDSPEEATQSGPKLKNADRRMFRGQRRVTRRRRQRMAQVRALLAGQGLLASDDKQALASHGIDPRDLRAAGLDRLLTSREWAIALGHIAKHRGFRSNSKREHESNAADENSKMLSAIDATREKLARYRTVAEMFVTDEEFGERKRNKANDYSRSVLRLDLEDEVRKLFDAQRRLGNAATSAGFQTAFASAAFDQRPLQSSETLVGECPFEPGEKRAARFAPSFERFRYYSRLAHLRIGRDQRPLTTDEIAMGVNLFGSKSAKITFTALRKALKLDDSISFTGVPREKEKDDIAARSGSAGEGTMAFAKALAGLSPLERDRILADAVDLDRAAEIIGFNEDIGLIRERLAATALSTDAQAAIMQGLKEGLFKKFKGAGHVSAKACRALLPFLAEGRVYSEACSLAGYDHSAMPIVDIKDISSPVARKAMLEAVKQVRAIMQSYGPFDMIHLEMARDIGKSIEKRREIERDIDKRTIERDRLRKEMEEHFPSLARISSEDLIRYELWKQQNGLCLYSGKAIPLGEVLASNNTLQVDHILPWSRFGDDSQANKTLCYVAQNAMKRGRTPFEWFADAKSPDEWERFVASVELCKGMRGIKKRNYLLRNAAEREEQFRSRNLNDTRYATRVLMARLKNTYFPDEPHRVLGRPGQLTSVLRRAWGLEGLKKKVGSKERLSDDRHHALDALIVALTSDRMLQYATAVSKQAEARGEEFKLRGLPAPWENFRAEVQTHYDRIIVSRAEIRRAKGKAHDATIKSIREVDGEQQVFERKAIDKLTMNDLDLIPVPKPYGKIADPAKLRDQMVEALKRWIDAGKPKDAALLPRSPKGDVIGKVTVLSKSKPAVRVSGGTADRGDMVRVDVFAKSNKRGQEQFFLVPIYRHEVATLDAPPNRAAQQGADEADWPVMGTGYEFRFSLYSMSLVEVQKKDGEIITGYYRGLDRTTGAFTLSLPNDQQVLIRGIGARTLPKLIKLCIDRLGNISEIKTEKRTWRGVVCT